MATFGGPADWWTDGTDAGRKHIATKGIVQDGLVLNLDAGVSDSYSGSGTTWTDLSGQGNNGTLTNGPTFNSGNGGSLVFDGVNDYITLGKSFISTGEIGSGNVNYTLESWFKYSGTPGSGSPLNGQSIIGNASSNGIGFQLETIGGVVKINFGARSTSNFDSNSSIISNTWYHVVCTREVGVSNKIYINGVLDSTFNISSLSIINTSDEMQIGWANGRVNDNFQGNIAVAKLYNTFLTSEEVQQNYNATKGRFGL